MFPQHRHRHRPRPSPQPPAPPTDPSRCNPAAIAEGLRLSQQLSSQTDPPQDYSGNPATTAGELRVTEPIPALSDPLQGGRDDAAAIADGLLLFGQLPPPIDPLLGGWDDAAAIAGGLLPFGQLPPPIDPSLGGWDDAAVTAEGLLPFGQLPPQIDPSQGGWGDPTTTAEDGRVPQQQGTPLDPAHDNDDALVQEPPPPELLEPPGRGPRVAPLTASGRAIFAVVRQIPWGRVTTHQDIARLLGSRDAARCARSVALWLNLLRRPGPDFELEGYDTLSVPWHRVVLASGMVPYSSHSIRGNGALPRSDYPGGMTGQARALRREGVSTTYVSGRLEVRLPRFGWFPRELWPGLAPPG